MKKILLCLVILGLILPACQKMTGRTAGETVDDAAIVSAVNAKIIGDKDLRFLKINVDSFEGNVTLSGTVPSKEAESRLMDMTRNVKGVKSVRSNLIIKPQ